MLRVGRITGAHGLKGALRLRPDNPDSDSLEQVARVFLESAGQAREFRLTGLTRLNATTRRITLEGVADVDAAEALKGAVVMLAAEDVPAAKPGEFYYYEAIGCEVFITDGSRLGTIEEIFSTGAHDIWVVRDGEREVLVPVIEDVVKAMDFAARRVTIEPIPGLLD
ncbi:MAG: ribosome maturation factor RimM [Candidatus Binatus sp.]|jgi:16S rRNA processing protein RimM|uniref:ribosome maturation factor RimM n=1 Tax=Candidatus Binatus sp. TaxID=2811406 RepID=UPI003D14259C